MRSGTREALEAWLAALSDEPGRAALRRALELDAPLLAMSFASLGSCLIARALAVPSLRELAEAWAREMEQRGEPWVQALRGVPLPVGLSVSHKRQDLPPGLEQRVKLRVADGAELELWRTMAPKNPLWPQDPPEERLAWSWRGAEKNLPKWTHGEAKFIRDGWGPESLVRAPGAAPIELPCAEEGTAHGSFSEDGSLIYLCGSHDEYAGGFVYVLDAATLEMRCSFDTPRPVSEVWGCDREDRLLLETYDGPALWIDGEVRMIELSAGNARLSPDGEHVASGDEDEVGVWSVKELLQAAEPEREGLPVAFDPTGERLVCHRGLYHGRTGALIAELRPTFSPYLEGGPAMPWFQCTERFLINLQSGLQMWSMATGEELAGPEEEMDGEEEWDDEDEDGSEEEEEEEEDEDEGDDDEWPASSLGMHFPQWYALAYDAAGTTLASLEHGHAVVRLHALPPTGEVIKVPTAINGDALAMSPDGERIAVANAEELHLVDRAGKTLRRCAWRSSSDEDISRKMQVRLRFSRDGERVALAAADQCKIWSVNGERDERLARNASLQSLPDFAEPALTDWKVESESSSGSVFTHLATGARVAFPAPAAWLIHPRDAHLAANGHAHVALRSK